MYFANLKYISIIRLRFFLNYNLREEILLMMIYFIHYKTCDLNCLQYMLDAFIDSLLSKSIGALSIELHRKKRESIVIILQSNNLHYAAHNMAIWKESVESSIYFCESKET